MVAEGVTAEELRERQTSAAVAAIKHGYPTAGLQGLVDTGLDMCALSWPSEHDDTAMDTALHLAARFCNAEAVRFLLEGARCDPRAVGSSGWMPHQYAGFYDCVPALKLRLGAGGGVPPDAEANGVTALQHAVDSGAEEAVGFLLQRGANPLRQIVDAEGRTRGITSWRALCGRRRRRRGPGGRWRGGVHWLWGRCCW